MRFTQMLETLAVATLAIMAMGCGDSGSPTVGTPDTDDSSDLPLCGKSDDTTGNCRPDDDVDAGIPCDDDAGNPTSDTDSDPQSDTAGPPPACPLDPILVPGMMVTCLLEGIPCVLTQDPVYCDWSCGAPPDGLSDLLFGGAPRGLVLRDCTIGGEV